MPSNSEKVDGRVDVSSGIVQDSSHDRYSYINWAHRPVVFVHRDGLEFGSFFLELEGYLDRVSDF